MSKKKQQVLDKSQSANFDVQIAHITFIMVQYLLASTRYWIEAYETLNGLFKDLKPGHINNKLNIKLLAAFNIIVSVLERLTKSIDIKQIKIEIIANIEEFKFT